MMKKIDLFLLKKFQSIVDWCQKYFGVDNFFIARVCLYLYIFGYMVNISGQIILEGLSYSPIIPILFSFFFSHIFSKAIDSTKKICYKNPELKNSRTELLRNLRILCVLNIIFIFQPIIEIITILGKDQMFTDKDVLGSILLNSGQYIYMTMLSIIPF